MKKFFAITMMLLFASCAEQNLKSETCNNELENTRLQLDITQAAALELATTIYQSINGTFPESLKDLADRKCWNKSIIDPWGKDRKYIIKFRETGSAYRPVVITVSPLGNPADNSQQKKEVKKWHDAIVKYNNAVNNDLKNASKIGKAARSLSKQNMPPKPNQKAMDNLDLKNPFSDKPQK